jgi:hypothetical protein
LTTARLRDIVGTVGHRFAVTEVRKVMHVHFQRLTTRTPSATGIAKFPYRLFLLGVHRDHRINTLDIGFHQTIDVAELLVASGMLRPSAS